MGILFKVVTDSKTAKETVDRIDQFLVDFRSTICTEKFQQHLSAVAHHKLDMFNSLSEESDSYWSEIRDGRFEWQAWRDEAVCLRSITQQDALKAFDDWLLPEKNRNMLVVQVIGSGSAGRPEVEAADVGDFYDSRIEAFRSACKKQFWGRVNSKLF